MAFYRNSNQLLRKLFIQLGSVSTMETRQMKRWVAPTLKQLKHRRDKIGPEPPTPRSTFLEWNYDAELFAFGKRLGEEFDKDLLKQALRQRQFVNMQEIKAQENGLAFEREPDNVEFIEKGEELIKNFIRDIYSKQYPDDVVDAVETYLTSEAMLGHIGLHLGLKDIVLAAEFPVENATLANAFKSIVAALEKSQNTKRAQLFVKDFVLSHMVEKDVFDDIFRPEKPLLYLNSLLKIDNLEARLCNQSAVNTILANYQVGLYRNKKLLGIGWGESIEIAKETAALDAIYRIYNNYKRN